MRRRQWHPTPVLLPGKSHGWRNPIGCSPWGREESDTTEWLHFHFSLSCIGEGNGNPLQYSCLENPRDGRAWWAAVYGVTQSQTWLTWLSSSSSSIAWFITNISGCITKHLLYTTYNSNLSLPLLSSISHDSTIYKWCSAEFIHKNMCMKVDVVSSEIITLYRCILAVISF